MRVVWHGDQVVRQVEQHMRRNLETAAIFVEREAKRNARAGGSSGFETSHGGAGLAGSIEHEVDWPVARIGSNLKYARIHELGGVIRPVTAQYLHFVIDGAHIMTKVVHMPARPYLRPAIDNNHAHIQDILARPMRG